MAEQKTLFDHLRAAGAKGGAARAKKLSRRRRVAIARNGGRLGGPARAQALSSERRQEIARKAGLARWARAVVPDVVK